MAPNPVSETALLIIDMINPMDFEGANSMLPMAVAAAKRIATLKRRFRQLEIPTIYVNDNFTQWRADFNEIVAICSHENSPGAPIAKLLPPGRDDYFILKPKHSGFHATPLPVLLEQLGTKRVVVTGVAGDGCVLATATDAHMRDFQVHVPSDAVASISHVRTERALALMAASMKIDTRSSRSARP